MLSLRDWGAGTLLLNEEPWQAEGYPVEIGKQEGVLINESVSSKGDQNGEIERQSDDITP